MATDVQICDAGDPDRAAILAIYAEAFKEEDLVPLVNQLLDLKTGVLSLAAWAEDQLCGHAIFTHGHLDADSVRVALLGPVAVSPAVQRKGIGTALIEEGAKRLSGADVSALLVLGDPAYYGRKGFVTEALIKPPYALPMEWEGAWQSRSLDGALTDRTGRLELPEPWMQPRLWLP